MYKNYCFEDIKTKCQDINFKKLVIEFLTTFESVSDIKGRFMDIYKYNSDAKQDFIDIFENAIEYLKDSINDIQEL